jgi:hypothetical protein
VSLEVDGVTLEFGSAGAEEMVEADLVEGGGGGVGGDVAANVVLDAVGADDHGQRIPANQAFDAALEFLISWEKRFKAYGDGVGVGGVGGEREVDAGDGGVGAKTLENFGGDFWAAGFEDGVEGLEPLLDFDVFDAMLGLCVGLVIH